MAHFPRSSGVLLHPTALPSSQGIGTIGRPSFPFLQWLADAGQSYWQICPLTPTGYGDSPYQGLSAFAGNPNLIDLESLCDWNLLTIDDLKPLASLSDAMVNFGRLIPMKNAILESAWTQFTRKTGPEKLTEAFEEFRHTSAAWLDEHCLFMTLKDHFGGSSWDQWASSYRLRDAKSLRQFTETNRNRVDYHAFVQFLFQHQWDLTKREAAQKGIRIIGDLPIFIAFDSADCWSRPELFRLDAQRRPTHVAGVPPDYFSETGQLWGNPLYNWDLMEENGFQWWISVLQNKLNQYDVLRIDHFRGFLASWSIPYGEPTAVKGQWVPSLGRGLFQRLRSLLGAAPIIAEDLGVITEDVVELMHECGFPGMKVLQFAFDSSEENDYLPHNYNKHCVVYTGTHDNDTTVGWYSAASDRDRTTVCSYLSIPKDADGKTVADAMLRAAMTSAADLAITPIQDILGLDSTARFNTPGVLGGNWQWRAAVRDFSSERARNLRELTENSGRIREKNVNGI